MKRNLYKIATLSILSAFSLSAYAFSDFVSGYHAALGIGYADWQGTAASYDDDGSLDGKTEGGRGSMAGLASVGFNCAFDSNWVWGGDVFVRYAPRESQFHGGGFDFVRWQGTWSYGLDVTLGHFITPSSVFYGLIGAEGTRYRIQTHGDQITEFVSFNKTKYAVMPGVGLITQLTPNWFIDTRYTWEFPQRISKTYDNGDRMNVRPTRSFISISVGYNFV